MRIYGVADIHGKKHHLAAIYSVLDEFKPDLMVVAGDLTNFLNWQGVLAQLDSLPVPVLAVRGNTDLKRMEPVIQKAANIELLGPTPVKHHGRSFVGTSGTLVLPFASRICLREKQVLSKLPSPMDPHTVLVVHPPPKGIRDRVGNKFSAGSKNLARFITSAAPGLVLCGHIHEQHGKGMLGKSLVVNCAMGKKSAGAIIDFKKDDPAQVKLLQP